MASVMPDLWLPSQLMLVPNFYCLVTVVFNWLFNITILML